MINNSCFFFWWPSGEDLSGDYIVMFSILILYLNIEDHNVHSEIIMIIHKIDLVWRASDGARGRLRSTTVNINMRMFLLHSKSHFKGVIHFPRIVG